MKQTIHPATLPTLFTCGNCGTEITLASTGQTQSNLDVCSNCHPAYTGERLRTLSNNRIDAYNSRYKQG